MLRCVAIDNDPLALQLIRAYIERVPSLKLVQEFQDALSAIEYLRQEAVQLIFVNIQMPDINGLDVARSLSEDPMFVFTTAQKKFTVEGFELDAVDYLVKPFSFDRFKRAIAKAGEYYKYKMSSFSKDEYLYVYSEYKLVKVKLDDIEFIESLQDYIRIHTMNGKPILSLMPLKKVIERLPAGRFQRVHRSYVIAINKIRSFTTRKVVLENVEVPVSGRYVDAIRSLKKP